MGLLDDLKGYDQILDGDNVPLTKRHTIKVVGASFDEESVQGVLVTRMTVEGGGGGEPGPTGATGATGAQGDPGPTGPTGSLGASVTHFLTLEAGTIDDWDIPTLCPGIKTGDKVALVLEGDVIVNSIILPENGIWFFLGIRDIDGGEYTLTLKDNVAGLTTGLEIRTPGAPESTDVGPNFVMRSGEDWTTIGHTIGPPEAPGPGGWRILGKNSNAANNGLSTVGGPGVPARFDLTHSPIALYHGAGDGNDYSGNGFHLNAGTLAFNQVLPNVKGLRAQASASAPRRSAHDATLAITGDITIQAIVELYTSPTSGSFIVSFTTSGSTLATNTLYQLGWDGSDDFRWLSESGAGVPASYVVGADGGNGAAEQLPFLRKLYYMAAVRQADVVQFYLNGLPFGNPSSALTTPAGGTSSVLTIAGFASGDFTTLGVKIIASALSAAQIKDEYNRTMGVGFGFLA